MKEQHQPAELEIIDITNADIIQTSRDNTGNDVLITTQNPNCPNEGPAGDSWV